MSDLHLLAGAATALDVLGRALWARVLFLNVSVAALLLVAVVLDRALARRARASLRIALYAPVAIRVLWPVGWGLHLGEAPRVRALLAPLTPIAGGSGEGVSSSTVSPYALVAMAYAFVVVALAARAIAGHVRLRRAVAAAHPVARPGAPLRFPLLEHVSLGPMAVGLVSPRVVVPSHLLGEQNAHVLSCVLSHEAAHVARRDAWLALGMQILGVVAWPVLPLHAAVLEVRRLVELSCDEAALAGREIAERRRYGHALLDFAERHARSAVPAGAGALLFGSTLRARIEALASHRAWPLAAQLAALSPVAILLVAACSGAGGEATATASGHDDSGYGYEFDTDSARASAKQSPDSASAPQDREAAKASPTNADGRIAPETIQTIVRSHLPQFRACYAAGQSKNPTLSGNVVVKTVVAPGGTTLDAKDNGSSLPDKDVVACVVTEFKTLSFPKTNDGPLTIVYPLRFTPDPNEK